MTEIAEITRKLKASPMFNLSLSSKELFHSNFLYWLSQCNETVRLFEYVVLSLSDSYEFDLGKSECKREENKFDLCIKSKLEEQIEFVIENKVKSFPNRSQLEAYENKVKDIQGEKPCTFILLSLFTTQDKKIGNWIQKSYKDLANALEKAEVLVEDKYCKNIIEDYYRFIINLNDICELTNLEKIKTCSFKEYKEDVLAEKSIYEELEKIRFHDFFLKAIYAQIAEKVYVELSLMYGMENVQQDFSIKRIMAEGREGAIYINHGFTRADGLIEVKIRTKDFVYLIQIQGDSYRRGFEGNIGEYLKNLSKQEENWVNFESIINADVKLYPTNDYNQYGGNFKYKSIKISSTDWNIGELIKQIVEDTKACINFVNLNK